MWGEKQSCSPQSSFVWSLAKLDNLPSIRVAFAPITFLAPGRLSKLVRSCILVLIGARRIKPIRSASCPARRRAVRAPKKQNLPYEIGIINIIAELAFTTPQGPDVWVRPMMRMQRLALVCKILVEPAPSELFKNLDFTNAGNSLLRMDHLAKPQMFQSIGTPTR